MELSDVKSWQEAEDARLEYEGYCNKIRQGLEKLDDKSGERALWELVQNARDMSKEARIKIENMYIVDFLIMNEDRHLNNFGIIRDVNTLKWLDVAPRFDNGQSLNIEYYDEEELHISGEGKLFYEVKPFDEIIEVVKDIKRIDKYSRQFNR